MTKWWNSLKKFWWTSNQRSCWDYRFKNPGVYSRPMKSSSKLVSHAFFSSWGVRRRAVRLLHSLKSHICYLWFSGSWRERGLPGTWDQMEWISHQKQVVMDAAKLKISKIRRLMKKVRFVKFQELKKAQPCSQTNRELQFLNLPCLSRKQS